MALSVIKFDKFVDSLAQKLIDLDSDTLKCLLLASYTPDAASHQFVSDVKGAGTETTGTGYTAGGVTLTSVTWAVTSNKWALKGTIPAWDTTGGSLSAAYALFYDSTPGSDATNPIICAWNLDGSGGTQTSSNGSFTLTQASDGIVTIDGA